MTTMDARVMERQRGGLLVMDHATGQPVRVDTRLYPRFRPGEDVRIWYSGAMTRSLPPRVTARRIRRLPPPPPPGPPPGPWDPPGPPGPPPCRRCGRR